MKKTVTMDAAAAFPDSGHEPNETELKIALGKSFDIVAQIEAAVREKALGAEWIWQYSERSGWYRLLVWKKRRLFYLMPKAGAFRLSLIIGDKAIARLKRGEFAADLERLLPSAKRYPEGTAFSFDETVNPALVAAFVLAKFA